MFVVHMGELVSEGAAGQCSLKVLHGWSPKVLHEW